MVRIKGLLIFLLGLALAACTQVSPSSDDTAGVVWRMDKGEIRGVVGANGVAEFRGIAYAAPPVGDLRWRAPQPPEPLSAMIDATEFGPACPQAQGNPDWYRTVAKGVGADPGVVPDLENISEDCLYLNVWSNKAEGEPKPVMVWIHGGSNVNGFSHEPNYRGGRLAAKGVVVVSVNYRMGALGFLPHPALDEEDPDGVSGYYGLADQIAALQWVQSNIAAFGGDAGNVTVFGESAGGGNISALMRTPSAKGLFHRAIIQSGALGPYDAIDYDMASKAGEALFKALSATSAPEMREISWQDLIARTRATLPNYYFGPVADGLYLAGAKIANPVPLMIGTNADEMLIYLDAQDDSPLESALSSYDLAPQSPLAAYSAQHKGSALMKANRLASAVEFFCPAYNLAEQAERQGAPVFMYYFTRVRPGGETLGAYHGAEIPYVFDTQDSWLPADKTDAQLTTLMGTYWTNFARSADPNGSKGSTNSDLPRWPRFDRLTHNVQELGETVGLSADNPASVCARSFKAS